MKSSAIRAMMLGVALLAPSLAHAQTIDQSLIWSDDPTNVAPSGQLFGQSFTPLQSNIVGAGAWIFNNSLSQIVSSLRVVLIGDDVGGNQTLADVTVGFELRPMQAKWIDAFWAAVSVTPGNINYLEYQTSDGLVGGPLLTAYNGADAYTGGMAFDSSDGTFNGDATFYDVDDFLFREYASTATPEPASLVLLGTGLVGVFGVVRRRRKIA